MPGTLPLSDQPFRLLEETGDYSLGLGQSPSTDWQTIAYLPLVILVGLTGAGKTTLLANLSQAPDRLTLPDRRQLTDQVILPVASDQPVASLTRQDRFAATARFRSTYPGGMAAVLSALRLRLAPLPNKPLLLFDGLRGRAEVESAAKALPNARFLLLGLDDDTRIARLAGRGDTFDGLGSSPASAKNEKLEKARAIVASESQSYSYEDSKAALQRFAPRRHLILNSADADQNDLATAAESFLTTVAE
ncbi:hypothetical protein ACTL6U_09085 [Rhodovibrionaceae bacterium A322]